MTVVKINVLEVPAGRGAALEERFAARKGDVDTVDGFESFELLRPTDGGGHYLVVTRWSNDAAFDAWMSSESFQQSHGGGHDNSVNDPTSGHPGAESAPLAGESDPTEGHPGAASAPATAGSGPDVGHPGASSAPGAAPSGPDEGHPGAYSRGGPSATGSELWSFEVVVSAQKA
ncbi:MAG: antibiotic biosynthesis monooxygenase [Nitriliruptor sp.]|nr:MAG: antibiotic biosynthesis monooxygenase [Nitriliruptor sp.]